jgi:hypothetical protein
MRDKNLSSEKKVNRPKAYTKRDKAEERYNTQENNAIINYDEIQ